MSDAIAIIVLLAAVCLILLAINWHLLGDNTRLRKANAEATKNDGRDPLTGRYTGA